MIRDVHQAKLAAFLAGLAVMYAIESLWPVRPWESPRWKRLGSHVLLSVINTVLMRFTVAAPLLLFVQYARDRGWGLGPHFGFGGPIWAIATIISFDLYDYWWHRINHEWSFFWRFHRVHHMDTHVDVTTSLRFHYGEFALSGAAKALWAFLWGPSVAMFALCEALISLTNQFHHSNIDLPDPVEKILQWITMTPRRHTAHHTVTLRSRNANYATIIAIWDKLFGTWEEPDRAELKTLGLDFADEREHYLGLKTILLGPLRT